MSTLSEHKLHYEDLTPKKTVKRGGKDSKMSKATKEVPTAKTRRAYSKTRGEHFKDILIAILITGIVAFVSGVIFANKQRTEVSQAVVDTIIGSTQVSAEESTPSK